MSDWNAEALKILQKIMSRKDSEVFKDEVDWEGLGLVDYPLIIKKPMHLRLVKSNLEDNVYRTPAEAAADVRLVFSNAMTYNLPGSRIYAAAKTLAELWEASWAATEAGASDDLGRPPSKDDLVGLVEQCHFISPEELGKVLLILEQYCPNSIVKKRESNEVDVNTDLISGEGFHEVRSFLESLLPQDEAGKTQSRKGSTETPAKELPRKAAKTASVVTSAPTKPAGRTSEPAPKTRRGKTEGRASDIAPAAKRARFREADEGDESS